MKFLFNWLVTAVALYAAVRLIPGLTVSGDTTIILAALVIGLANAVIKPLLLVLTLPITVLTLGLFYFVLNGAMLYLAAALTPGFEVEGWGAAILGALVMSIVASLIHLVVKEGGPVREGGSVNEG